MDGLEETVATIESAVVGGVASGHVISRGRTRAGLTILVGVAALGYFVDVYDLLLFSAVRTPSLLSLGVATEATLSVGLRLLNWQMIGLLIGGVSWGILGDKRGRLSVLFGSIVIYSIANFLNGFVQSIWQYEALRLIAGIGLAGELGAGISIVSESMTPRWRGIGTMIVATVGLFGAVMASVVSMVFDWRTAYIVGGVLGLVLLVLRIGVYESGLYESVRRQNVVRGSLKQLFSSRSRVLRFVRCVLVGLPTYFIVGILVTGAPEFGKALNVSPLPTGGTAVMVCYLGMALGDVICSGFSQLVRRRRIAFGLFNGICFMAILIFLYAPSESLQGFYARCFLGGFSVGYWALISTNAAEQFGTNLRATVTTITPNLVRAALVPIAFAFEVFKPHAGLIGSAALVGMTSVAIALVALYYTKETFGSSMDFVEQ